MSAGTKARALAGAFALGLALSVASVAQGQEAAPVPSDFAYGMKFETRGVAAGFRSALPAEVYRGVVRADLGDVAVFNERNEVVPHALERPRTTSTVPQAPISLPIFPLPGGDRASLESLRVTLESGAARVRVESSAGPHGTPAAIESYVIDARASSGPISALDIGWVDDAPTFAGRLRVEASDDLALWQTLRDAAPVANLRAGDARLIERRIETRPVSARFWRLSWVGERAPFEIVSVTAEPAGNREEVGRPSFSVAGTAAEGRPGEFEFDLGAHFPVDRVTVELPEPNSIVSAELLSRASPDAQWVHVTRNGFYRLRSTDAELVNGDVSIPTNANRYWLARVDTRGNGLGSGVPKLRVAWVPHEIVFVARGDGPFTLAFGNASAKPASAAMMALPKGAPVLHAPLGERELLGGESRRVPATPNALSKSAVLWAVLGAGVVLLAYMAYRLSRELRRSA